MSSSSAKRAPSQAPVFESLPSQPSKPTQPSYLSSRHHKHTLTKKKKRTRSIHQQTSLLELEATLLNRTHPPGDPSPLAQKACVTHVGYSVSAVIALSALKTQASLARLPPFIHLPPPSLLPRLINSTQPKAIPYLVTCLGGFSKKKKGKKSKALRDIGGIGLPR